MEMPFANGSETTTSSPSSLMNTDNTITNKDDDDVEIMMDENKRSAQNAVSFGGCGGGVAPPINDNNVDDNDVNGGDSTNTNMENGDVSCDKDDLSKTIVTIGVNANEIVVDTPTRRNNSRLIKKRREDGFFYAQDDRKEGMAVVGLDKKINTTSTNNEHSHQQNQNELKDKKADTSSIPSTSKSKHPQQGDEGQHQPTNKERKRKYQKCPTRDTILIQIPLSVTADLGVAMKRTRKNRMKRIKRWLRMATMQEDGHGGGGDNCQGKSGDGIGDGGPCITAASKSLSGYNEQGLKNDIIAAEIKDADEDNGDDDNEDDDCNNGLTNKNQYSSIVDYLEAKYVRGVMIDDYDEKVARKMKTNKVKTATNENDGEGGNDDKDEDSEKEGSIYSSDGGFIDDSLLNEEIVEQVMASSTYGMTQIEEEARRRKHQDKKMEQQRSSIGSLKDKNDDNFSNGEDGSESNDEEGSETASAAHSDFDDGFFVNLGDLEMAEGWSGDVVITPTKNKNKKRAYNKKTTTSSSNASKSDGKIAKKKTGKVKAAPPGGGKKKLLKDANKKLLRDAKSDNENGKNKNKNKTDIVETKKNKADTSGESGGGGKVGNGKTPTISKKKKDCTSSPKTKATEMTDTQTNAKSPEASIMTTTKPSKSALPPKDKTKKPVSKEKERVTQLRLIYKRRYNSCIKLIEKMTNDELPRKPKAKNTMKVSVNIPADKEIGDELTFGNPNVPGQKLKVQIPKNADMEKRRFVVSIPTPKVTEPVEIRDNNFSKAFREALFNYSNAYDDWCNAEGERNESMPAKERKSFKPSNEKLKKFDDMANEFPKNLATPVDASCLRKIAKQERSNRARRDKRRSGGSSTTFTCGAIVKVEQQLQDSEVYIPPKGTDFPSVRFDIRDFS